MARRRSQADLVPPCFGTFSDKKEETLCYKAEPRHTELAPSPDSYDSPNCRSLSSHLPDCPDGDAAMKKLFLILIAGFALVMAHDFKRAYAGDHNSGDDGGIPLSKLAGKYSVTFTPGGFFTTCFKPDFSATESCSTPGAIPLTETGDDSRPKYSGQGWRLLSKVYGRLHGDFWTVFCRWKYRIFWTNNPSNGLSVLQR